VPMAMPMPGPHVTPMNIKTISCPNNCDASVRFDRGGNSSEHTGGMERTMRMAMGINQVAGVLHVSSQRRRRTDHAPQTYLRIQSVAGSSAWMIGFSKTFTSTKMVRMNRTSASFTIVRTLAHAGSEYRVSRTPVLALEQIQRVVPAIVVE
jgi:hypothetical protein